MKILSLLLGIGLVVVEPMAGFGQVAPPTVQARLQKSPPPSAPESENLAHFDLDFPGGPPRQLVAAISKASGKHLNVIIPARNAEVQIMPIKVENVTVRDLFRAIQTASALHCVWFLGNDPVRCAKSMPVQDTGLRTAARRSWERRTATRRFRCGGREAGRPLPTFRRKPEKSGSTTTERFAP